MISTTLKSLLTLLLVKNPKLRLGSPQQGGVPALKQHAFFKNIDWDQVYNKAYKMPIKPKVKGPGDTRYIEKSLLKEKVEETQ